MEFALIFFAIIVIIGLKSKNATKKHHYRPSQKANTYKPKPDLKSTPRDVQNKILLGPAYVVDGDSLVIKKIQIRLFGIDAPELNHPYGKKAKWALIGLCKGQTISAEIIDQDAHGRTVAKCCLQDGRDLSAEMVKLGLAIDWPKFSNGKYGPLEIMGVRKKLWLADARQKGRLHVWKKFEENKVEHTKRF